MCASKYLFLFQLLEVELEFLAFEEVSVASSRLSGSRRNASEDVSLVDLIGELRVNLGLDSALQELGGAIGLVGLLEFFSGFPVEVQVLVLVRAEVVLGDVFAEGVRVDLDDGVLDESVGSDVLVVGGVVDDVLDLGLESNTFGSPVEVAVVNSEGTELEVASANSDLFDLLIAELGVSSGTAGLVGAFLLVDGNTTSGESSLVTRIS